MTERINVLPANILEERGYHGARVTPEMLREALVKSKKKLVILDDDPTGVQTVHGVCVYTDWRYESVLEGFQESNPVFFILTNSRAMQAEKTVQVHRAVSDAIVRASRATGKDYLVISRTDSTLRGHYREEMGTLRTELEQSGNSRFDGEIFCPFFEEGGRVTMDDIHYVRDNDQLFPCALTEFAHDRTFGYHHSDLKEYLKEKLNEEYREKEVVSISLEDLAGGDVAEVYRKLKAGSGYRRIIVNAISMDHLNVFVMALYRLIGEGRRFLVRSAASLVKALSGISDRPYLTGEELLCPDPYRKKLGGLIVAGSYTKRTNEQLERLKADHDVVLSEFDTGTVLLSESDRERKLAEFADAVHRTILSGKTAVVYTSRKPAFAENMAGSMALDTSVKISEALQKIVSLQKDAPSFLIAKGGITSSDIGVKALGIRRAEVMGQAAPGVPVWKTDETSRFPRIAFIIFPGNVGNRDTLREIIGRINSAM